MQVKPSTLNVMIGRMEKNRIYREKTKTKKIQEKAEFILLRREEVSVKTVIKKFVMIQEKTSRVFYKRGAGRTQETVK